MNRFIRKLLTEHEHGLVQLGFLDDATQRMNKKGFSEEDFRIVKKSSAFISHEVRLHSESEEINLFPLLEKHLSQNGPTQVMRVEHRLLWDRLNKFNKSIEMVENDKNNLEFLKSLRSNAQQIVGLLSEHIYKENNILFPMAEKILTENELKLLAEIG